MATFTIYELPYLRRHQDRVRAAREAAGIQTPTAPMKMAHTAADTLTLRGIPAVGRGVAGAIRGTNPEAYVTGKSANPFGARAPDERATNGLDTYSV